MVRNSRKYLILFLNKSFVILGWSDEKKAAGMLSKIPLNRFAGLYTKKSTVIYFLFDFPWIEVEDVVDPIIFLLSDKSQMINGVALPIGKI